MLTLGITSILSKEREMYFKGIYLKLLTESKHKGQARALC